MDFDLYKNEAELGMQKAVDFYKLNILKISAGRANPKILDNIKVMYYETPTPIEQIASISIPEPRQLLIKPYDHSNVKDITATINAASLGIHAIDEGDKIRMMFPEITTERRKELVKHLVNYTEHAKIAIRLSRQDANKAIKLDKNFSEDDERKHLKEIQNLTNKYIDEVNTITLEKEKDLMTM